MFLIKIINNDFDGAESFKIAQECYVNKVEKRDENRVQAGQQARFDDNSAACFVVISTDPMHFCKVIHVNDEVESLFGFKRKDILDKNISSLMPPVIGQHHDAFVRKFLAAGKMDLRDKIKQSLGQTLEGYIFSVDILIKIYPKISGEIQLVGAIQKATIQ